MRTNSLLALLLLLLSSLSMAQGVDKAEFARIAKLEKAQATAKAGYLKNPKNVAVKKKYVKATTTVAYEIMTSPAVPPREKYPKALRYYREAKKVDPKNKDANRWIAEIESIYKSMGRPIPPG